MKAIFSGLRNGHQNQLAPPISKKGASLLQSKSRFGLSNHQEFQEIQAPEEATSKKEHSQSNIEARPTLKPKESSLTSKAADVSLVAKFHEVADVDSSANDSVTSSCQQVPCYVKHIYSYLQELELELLTIRPDFLQVPVKLEITPKMRHVLFDWLVQVHGQFNLQPETLYLTFHILDTYLSSPEGAHVKKANFQLLGVSALFLASKYEDTFAPSIHDVVHVTSYSCTELEIRSTERRLLQQLDYRLGFPAAIQFLRRWGRVANASRQRHELAKYLAELGRLAYPLAHLPPSGLAAAAFLLAGELLAAAAAGPENGSGDCGWSDALEVYSGYSCNCLLPAVRLLAVAAASAPGDKRHSAVRKKYASPIYLMVSTLPELHADNPLLRRYITAATD